MNDDILTRSGRLEDYRNSLIEKADRQITRQFETDGDQCLAVHVEFGGDDRLESTDPAFGQAADGPIEDQWDISSIPNPDFIRARLT